MKRTTQFVVAALAAVLMLFFVTTGFTQTKDPAPEHRPNFVDENGDGYNDNAPDADGDGIPNRYDSDWEFFVDEDGDGVSDQTPGRKGKGRRGFIDEDGNGVNDRAAKRHRKGRLFIDEDSDGVCDLFQDEDGDGIVNCKDEDWDRPAGQGKRRFGNRRNGRRNAPADDGNEPEDGTGN